MELFQIKQPINLGEQSIEQVTPQKQEYKLVGSYLRTKGLGLYCYNQFEDTVSLVTETIPTKVRIIVVPVSPIEDRLDYEEYEHKRCEVDPRFYYFEALRLESAIARVDKWKNGKISILCNLKEYDPNAKISFY